MRLNRSFLIGKVSGRTLILAAILGCGAVAASADTVLYQSGFEPPAATSGELAGQDGWQGSTLLVVQSATARTGAGAVALTAPVTATINAIHAISYNANDNRETTVRVSIDMRIERTSSNIWTPIVLFGTNAFLTQVIVRNGVATLGLANSSVGAIAVNPGDWNTYTVEVNAATQTVTAWVNGTLLAVGAVAFSPNTINRVGFGSQASPTSETGVFDNLSVRSQARGDAPLTFTTYAGHADGYGQEDGAGATARFAPLNGITVSPEGDVYVADLANSVIRKIAADGHVTTLAGVAGSYGVRDGPTDKALLACPSGLTRDAGGTLYLADSCENVIRKISSSGIVTTLAGTAGITGSIDSVGAAAQFSGPVGVALDPSGVVYVSDGANSTIRKITPDGRTTTIAGLAGSPGSDDGTGSAARFRNPTRMAADAFGNLYVADTGNHTIRRITAEGVVTTVAGQPGNPGSTDGPVASALLRSPRGVTVDSTGTLFVCDAGNHTIRKVTATGIVTTFAGTAGSIGTEDGTGAAARLETPYGIAVDDRGNLFVADYRGAVRRITAAGVVTTLAGRAMRHGSTDGDAATALFELPRTLTVDRNGNVFVGDTNTSTLRRITPEGVVSTFAGAVRSGTADGVGTNARFGAIRGLTSDAQNNIYVADSGNHTIRKITPGGVVTTIAGSAGVAGSADGVATGARFSSPTGIVMTPSGDLYVSDSVNATIRRIGSNGIVSTIAGLAGERGTTNGTRNEARFLEPQGIVLDGQGNVFVADECSVRRITPDGSVTTLAGVATACSFADGVGSAARLGAIGELDIDPDGNIVAADYVNSAIRMISPSGSVTTLTSHRINQGAQDGTGTTAQLAYAFAVRFGTSGALYVADTFNSRILIGRESLPDFAVIDAATTSVGTPRALSMAMDTATSWQWVVTRRPADSRAELTSSTSKSPGFTPDKAGLYQFRVKATRLQSISITTVDLVATAPLRRRTVRK